MGEVALLLQELVEVSLGAISLKPMDMAYMFWINLEYSFSREAAACHVYTFRMVTQFSLIIIIKAYPLTI